MQRLKYAFIILAYKESQYLEECIKSVVNQTANINVFIASSTPNSYIESLAKKYDLQIIVNKNKGGIAADFNFALNCVKADIVTIAHQDDLYDEDYAKTILDHYQKYEDSTILFTNYYEIRNNQKVYSNNNIRIKKVLLIPLKFKVISRFKFIKRLSIRFGNSICCPAVSFCMKNITAEQVFMSSFTSNMDWLAWEKISKMKGRFIYINKPLMGHRVHEESTTTKIIKDGKRTNEDYEMFCMFWPKFIAKIITKIYQKGEKSNEIK